MTNFHDLKTRDLSPKENEVAVEMLAAWLYAYSETFDYDNATVADARIVAAGILAEAKELCDDEGCPQAGTAHVYTSPALHIQQYGRGRRPCMGCGVIPKDELGCATVGCSERLNTPFGPRISSRESEQRGRSFGFISPEQAAEVNRKFLDKDKK